jgi:hypothetical protein
MGIVYEHGLRFLMDSPGLSWDILKICSFIGFIYGLYYGFWDITLIFAYSFISKFVDFREQIPAMIVIMLLLAKDYQEKLN